MNASSILARQLYIHMAYSVFGRNEIDVHTALETSFLKLDEDLKEIIINIYLSLSRLGPQ